MLGCDGLGQRGVLRERARRGGNAASSDERGVLIRILIDDSR